MLAQSHDPESVGSWLLRFMEHLRTRNYSPWTISNRERYGRHFVAWCDARGVVYPQEVTKPMLDAYQRGLFHYRNAAGEPLGFSSQAEHLVTVRQLFKWLMRQNVVLWVDASLAERKLRLEKLEAMIEQEKLKLDKDEQARDALIEKRYNRAMSAGAASITFSSPAALMIVRVAVGDNLSLIHI